MKEIILGKMYKDNVSGFEGTAIAKTQWMNGCHRAALQPKIDKDGKLPDTATFDVDNLVEIGETVKDDPTPRGGPRNDAAALQR